MNKVILRTLFFLGITLLNLTNPNLILSREPVGLSLMYQFDRLPYFKDGVKVYQYSSYDRTGGNDDGIMGTFSYLYRDTNNEYVIFDESRAGCIYRFWFTGNGDGTEFGNIRFYFDGELSPRVDLPVTQFFSGTVAPFLTPLVGNKNVSSGGFYCYLPFPFTKSCKVTTTKSPVPYYYHITYHIYDSTAGVTTYTGQEDITTVKNMWTNVKSDPKPTVDNVISTNTVILNSNTTSTVLNISGSGCIASIKVDITPSTDAILENTRIRMYWDNNPASVDVPVGEFFGSGWGEYTVSSLPIGMSTTGNYYCYFPMPYWSSAKIEVYNGSNSTVNLSYEIQYNLKVVYPQTKTGYFHTQANKIVSAPAGVDYIILKTQGKGHFVGTVLSMTANDNSRMYLEGDERVYIDGNLSPQLHGTGTEDYFNGGWYFEKGTFNLPVHGNPVHEYPPNNPVDRTGCYRFNLTDYIPFHSSITIGIEYGVVPTNAQYSSVAYLYKTMDSKGDLELTDELNVGNTGSETAHNYIVSNPTWQGQRTLNYEGEYDDVMITDDGRSFTGNAEFKLKLNPNNNAIILRRRTDQSVGRQKAQVYIDNALVGVWYNPNTNTYQRWLDTDFMVPETYTKGKDTVTVKIQFISSSSDWNEYYYWIYSVIPASATPGGQDTTPPSVVADLSAQPGLVAGDVNLCWTSSGDDGMSGQLQNAKFKIQYANTDLGPWTLNNAQVTISTSGVNPGTVSTYLISGLTSTATHYFCIWTADDVGNWSGESNKPYVYVADTSEPTVPPPPPPLVHSQAKPDEKFVTPKIPAKFGTDAQEVNIYDTGGNLTLDLVKPDNGQIIWNGTDKKGNHLESGAYIYKIKDRDGKLSYGLIILAK